MSAISDLIVKIRKDVTSYQHPSNLVPVNVRDNMIAILELLEGIGSGEQRVSRKTDDHTLVLIDAESMLEMNAVADKSFTVPANEDVAFPLYTSIYLARYGTGELDVVAADGVTIRSADDALRLAEQYSGAVLFKIDEDEWYLFGDIIAV